MADSLCRAVGAGSDKDFILLACKAYCAYTGKSELGGEFKDSITLFLLKEPGCVLQLWIFVLFPFHLKFVHSV